MQENKILDEDENGIGDIFECEDANNNGISDCVDYLLEELADDNGGDNGGGGADDPAGDFDDDARYYDEQVRHAAHHQYPAAHYGHVPRGRRLHRDSCAAALPGCGQPRGRPCPLRPRC